MCRHPETVWNPLQCILPPYVLEHIIQHGTRRQSKQALRSKSISAAMRKQRKDLGAYRPPGSKSSPVKKRMVYSANNGAQLPGTLLRSEGSAPSGDRAADEAYDGAGATYDLFREVFDRNSLDGRGMPLISTVHYQFSYDNAFWNGLQMVYGDGDEDMPEGQRLFNRFTAALDVIAHELSHGVIQHSANLEYYNQSGALNESMADVFGVLVRQRVLNQSASAADWIIGAGLITPNVQGRGIRSMASPGSAYNDPVLGRDLQPGHMNQYVTTTADSGGVHINSGIPNKAFYLTAQEIGGYAWDKAGKIWYKALTQKFGPATTFAQAARYTIQAAQELYGAGSREARAVQYGWNGVGVMAEAGGSTPPPPPTKPDGSSGPDGNPGPDGSSDSATGCLTALLGLGNLLNKR